MTLKNSKSHINRIKVRYSEVDCQKIVYNSHYLTYYDISLSEMLDSLFDQSRYVSETNNDFNTVSVEMNFKKPAGLNDNLEVYTSIKKIGNSSIKFFQEIYKSETNDLLNEAYITWVNTEQTTMKSASLPNEIKEKLNNYLID